MKVFTAGHRGPPSWSLHRLEINRALGKFAESLVGRDLLSHRLLEKLDDVLLLQKLRVGTDRAVAGHFVVLDTLGGGDEGRVLHFGLGVLLDRFFTLLDDALDGLAGLLLRRLAERLEGLFESFDVAFGLPQMLLEGRLQLRRDFAAFAIFGERLGDPAFGVVEES